MDEVNFDKLLQEQGLSLTARQMEQFDIYYRQLVEWNKKMNLTAITDREQVYEKHFFDSLSLSFFCSLDKVVTLADIGSGAGFPSLPLKIVFPWLKVTIIDSLQKRITFLNSLVSDLNLTGVTTIHSRAEDAGRDPKLRDRFDLVTARAVARLPVLNEFCLPFVKVNGLFIAMKGSDPKEELVEASKSLAELRAEVVNIHEFTLPFEQSKRHLVVTRKHGQTPGKYPRKAGIPLKLPLM